MTGRNREQRDESLSRLINNHELSRRQLLLGAAGAGLAMGAGDLLLRSGPAGASSLAKGLTKLPGGTPKRGGTLRVGIITSGSEENLFPGTAAANPDMSRCYSLYDYLFYLPSGKNLYPLVPGLALSADPNAAADVWTIKLRPGVTWHDGKNFTASDVVYNFQHLWGNASSNYSASFLQGLVDFKNVKALDSLTVQVPLVTPAAEFPSVLGFFNFGVLQEGATAKSVATNPVGTGPFVYKSFTPGQQSVFTANKNYWQSGKPYVDSLVIDTTFTDNTALLNALLSGNLDCVVAPALDQARAQLSSKQVQVLESECASQTYMFGMRVDKGPFVNNDVREAFKLLVNRQEIIDGALAGFGSVGNDLMGPYTPYFASSLKPKYDLDKAKYLFKKAGVLGETFNWPTANAFPGMVESLTIMAEQAQAAGVKINVETGSPGTYFTSADGAYTRYASQNVWQPSSSLMVNYRGALTVGAPYPDTHWGMQKPGGAAANALIAKAIAATNPTKAEELWHEVQVEQVNEGGFVVWGDLNYIDLAANNVRGLSAGGGLNFNMFKFQDGWLE